MNADELERVKKRLQRRRREILAASGRAATGIEELRRVQRAAEPTEASQSEQLQYELSQLGEVEQREIALIDAALARADAGEYGTCRDCGEPIEPGRLAALPFVLECAACAARREEAEAIDREARKRRRIMVPD